MNDADNDLSRFFQMIYGESEGHAVIVTRDENDNLTSERYFEYPRERDYMVKYVEIRADEDVYCSVTLFSEPERNAQTASIGHAVYADADTCHPDNYRLPPTASVQTSEGHWHAWWQVDQAEPARALSDASRRIYNAHKEQGTDAGWSMAKLLRVPGTTNNKREVPEPVTVTYSDNVYTLDTINDVYSDIEVGPVVLLNSDVPDLITGKKRLALEERLDSAGLSSLYLERPPEGESWYPRLFKLELELFREGMSAAEVFTLAKTAACNKYERDNRTDLDLWKDVQKAEAEHLDTLDVQVEETASASGRVEPQQFLTLDERKFCAENPTFIDTYTEWVAGRTDAAPTYQRTLAWLLLSSVFGGRGYLPLTFGKTELNLWVLILGDTTRTRKSTAKGFYMKALRQFEAQSGLTIDIGSETTTEAIIKELALRDGLVSVMHRDEVNGWFTEMMTKNYRSGTLETFTELYDGNVPVVLRATKDGGNKKRARTVFNFLGVGIRKRTAEILTRNHFESGFLARMLWCVADPPPRVAGSEDIQFEDANSISRRFDTVLNDMVTDLIERVQMWSLDDPSPIKMDRASQNRYNKWAEATIQVAEKHGDGEILIPSFKRMAISVAKCAALMAMYDQTDKITLRQLLPALQQAEAWFNDMVRMASEVSSSDFERRLTEVDAFIRSGEDGTRLESTVRRKFSKYRPRDMEEILTALKASGRVKALTGPDKQKIKAL